MTKKEKAIAAARLAFIKAIVDATKAASFVFTSEGERGTLVSEGLIEVNAGVVDPSNAAKIATRATPAGISMIDGQAAAAPAPAASEKKSDFEIESGIELPAVAGRGRTGSTYPFDKLEVGQSFFVEKPAKALASTVSSAIARFAVDVPGQTRTNRKGKQVQTTKPTRVFVVRSAKKTVNGAEVSGSRIFRTV